MNIPDEWKKEIDIPKRHPDNLGEWKAKWNRYVDSLKESKFIDRDGNEIYDYGLEMMESMMDEFNALKMHEGDWRRKYQIEKYKNNIKFYKTR